MNNKSVKKQEDKIDFGFQDVSVEEKDGLVKEVFSHLKW